MTQYLLLKKIDVQNANAIAGLTYGFPAITHFLGFAHALSRKLSTELPISLGGVTVVSHKNDVQARQPKGWGDYVFALTRNPLTQKGETAPINEEGRMFMQVSLLIEINGIVAGDKLTTQSLMTKVANWVPTMRLAGGQVLNVEHYELLNSEDEQRNAIRRLMPGFVLIDRHEYLKEHYTVRQSENEDCSLMDAWCDFAALKYAAKPLSEEVSLEEDEKKQKATWEYQPKPRSGYLVPILTGYCAISKKFDAGEVANVRDQTVPVVFTEAAYSIGEWMSIHRIQDIHQGIWRYHAEFPWYIAKGTSIQDVIPEPDFINEDEEMAGFDPDLM